MASVLTTYYLQPPEGRDALSFHFGRQGIGMEEASETLASDSVFAALVTQAVLLDPRSLGSDGGPAFAQPFVGETSAPPFALSSLFPRLGQLILLPRPALTLPKMSDAQREQIGKGFKKLRYLSPRLFADVCANRPFAAQPIIMQKGKVWLSLEEARALPRDLPQPWQPESGTRKHAFRPWGQQSDESEPAWLARLGETPIWDIDSLPHVTVDRVSNASAYFEVGRVTYAPGAGLALLVGFADPAAQAGFERLLSLLGESGLGGRRSSGAGGFTWQRGQDLSLDMGQTGDRRVLLSRYLPLERELAALRSDRASYQLVNVGGWLYSTGRPAQRRQRVRMVAEGAVLDGAAISEPLRGKLEDVRPDYSKSRLAHPILQREKGTTHPVYRSGMALALAIPDKEGA
ncbi:type III-A CRISPR-associated RAMP protein Csm4 [Chloroflexales bacterium ZM16-3]|nr:type III-A CRISPR-associated RAMP protein Csm4 [Chloroflexales bacterium ZM16-3]